MHSSNINWRKFLQAGASQFTSRHRMLKPKCAHGWRGSSPRGTDFIPQPDGDLGVRLISAMDHGFASGADLVFFLGGDCPGTTRSYLEEAEAALAKTDMVIAGASTEATSSSA